MTAIALGLLVWAGAGALISASGWARTPTLVDRLEPHQPGGRARHRGPEGLRAVAEPLLLDLADRLGGVFWSRTDLERRLPLIAPGRTAGNHRLVQAIAALASGVVGALLGAVLAGPIGAAAGGIGAAAVAILVREQQLSTAFERHRSAVADELATVTEQLGMLLTAGCSLNAALHRLVTRGRGVVAQDLTTVVRRVERGEDVIDALRSWSRAVEVPSADRLVSVLTLHRTAGDLGPLLTVEARTIRRESHRELLAQIERRSQQVWIPVTVATLVPGVIFLLVPFLAALRSFAEL